VAGAVAFVGRRASWASGRTTMGHRERIERALALQPTDRVPFGFWRHFPNRDRSPRRLAELALALQRQLDLDFIKFSPYGLYSVVDWGVTLDVRGGQETPIQASYPIQEPADWGKLRRFRGDEGEYLVVLEAQRIALAEGDTDVPLVQTVFSPLTSCLKMAGRETLLRHLREAPRDLHAGLEIVAETTRGFAVEVVRRGADGLFFASQMSNAGGLSPAEHAEFAKRYDLAVLDALGAGAWFNILHLHGPDVMFEQVRDYPVQALSYHARETGPLLAEARRRTDKCLVGGLDRNHLLVDGTPEEIETQVEDAWAEVGRRGLILGPGCVANVASTERNLTLLRGSVERTRGLD